jgi:hypothetical protein
MKNYFKFKFITTTFKLSFLSCNKTFFFFFFFGAGFLSRALRAGRPGLNFRQRQAIFLYSKAPRSAEAHAAYPMGTAGSFPWGKAAGA